MKKISKTKIAATYAQALLEAAVEKKTLTKVFADITALREAMVSDTELVKYMTNPLWGEADKQSVLAEIAKKLKLTTETANALVTIWQNRRFAELPLILEEFVHLYYRHQNMAEAEVESAVKLTAAQTKKISAVLEQKMQQQIVLKVKILPELIGGLRIKIGSKMFDDTIAAKLNRLEIMMKGE